MSAVDPGVSGVYWHTERQRFGKWVPLDALPSGESAHAALKLLRATYPGDEFRVVKRTIGVEVQDW